MTRWSKFKKTLEDGLAKSVRGRVEFHAAQYRKSGNFQRGWGILGRTWITIDKHDVIEFSSLLEQLHLPHSEWQWNDVGRAVTNDSLDTLLESKNPILRALAILDSRCGKRRLRTMDIDEEHPIVRRMFLFRCYCEGLRAQLKAVSYADLLKPIYEIDKGGHDDPDRADKETGELQAHSRVKDIKSLINKLYRGDLQKKECTTRISEVLRKAFLGVPDRELYYQKLRFIASRSKLFDNVEYVNGIVAVLEDESEWVRLLDEWKPRTRNIRKQFSSLLRHLFAKYDVPLFMDVVWYSGDDTQRNWFKHIGSGKNIRTAYGLPLKLNKRSAHYFLQAPPDYSIEAAFRYGQIYAEGGDQTLSDALLDTRLVRQFENDDFWLSVIRFFIRNPMLDRVWVNPIVDYLYVQKFQSRRVRQDGEVRMAPPPQPDLTMRGRTALALIRQVEEWHGRLGRSHTKERLTWAKSDIDDFRITAGQQGTKSWKQWQIYELLDSDELIAEGREQHHCVASYIESCASGARSIWSMDLVTESTRKKCLTIELETAERRIRQVRGKRNRFPTQKELKVLRKWANAEELEFYD